MFQIQLFGGLRISAPGNGPIGLSSRSSRTLLAYLALHPGRLLPRERLAGLLWPDRGERAASKMLRTALWRMREALPVGDLVTIHGARIGLDPPPWIDVEEFRASMPSRSSQEGGRLADEEVVRLERGLDLYRGDLLEDVDEHWADGPRETLRLLRQEALERLLAHCRAVGDLRRAILRGRELVRCNPFLEHVHRELMLCHWALGDRPMAIRQYQACEEVLRRELELEPMAETRELRDRIRAGEPCREGRRPPHPPVVRRSRMDSLARDLHRSARG